MVKKFKWNRALKKGLIAGGAIAVGMAAAVTALGGLTDPEKVTAIGVVSAIVAGIRAGANWWKVNKKLKGGLFVGLTVLMVVSVSGCVSTKFDETVTDADGSMDHTQYRALSMAWPLGKVDTTNHEWRYKWGGEENEIQTGQAAKGIDNSGQKVLVEVLGQAVMEWIKTMAPLPVPAPTTTNGVGLEDLLRPVVGR